MKRGRPIREVSILDFGGVADCINDNPTGATDNTGALQAAINAACGNPFPNTGQRPGRVIIPASPDNSRSYFFAGIAPDVVSEPRIEISGPVDIVGEGGAFYGRCGTRLTVAPGCQGFVLHNNFFTRDGGDATGARIEGVHIKCLPTVSSVTWASQVGLTPSAGTVLKPALTNRMLYKVVTPGVLSAEPTTGGGLDQLCHVPATSRVWTPNTAVFYGNKVRPTNPTNWQWAFALNHGIGPGGTATTTSTEPSWNFTDLAITTDGNGNQWQATLLTGSGSNFEGAFFLSGTCLVKSLSLTGIFATCPHEIYDVYVQNAQTVGYQVYGSDPAIFGSSSFNVRTEGLRVDTFANGVGVYTRGGVSGTGHYRNILISGSGTPGVGTQYGTQPLGVGGSDPNQHGIVDSSTSNSNCWENCHSEFHSGYDIWALDNVSYFSACSSFHGRVRLDGSNNCWAGPVDAFSFWSTIGIGEDGLGGGLINGGTRLINVNSITGTGGDCVVSLAINSGPTPIAFQAKLASDNNNNHGPKYQLNQPGWWDFMRGFGGTPHYSYANGQSDGEHPSAFRLWNGRYEGSGTLSAASYVFTDLGAFRSPIRNGVRNVGDRVGEREIVTTAGYAGLPWHNGITYTHYIAAPAAQAQPRQLIIPSSGVGNAFAPLSDGSASSSEPNWASAPNVGNTLVDNGVTLQNIGPQPVTTHIAGPPAPGFPDPVLPSTGRLATIGGGGNLFARYRSDVIGTSGPNVTSVTDQASTHHLQQGTSANQPQLLSKAQNGHDLISHNGSQWLVSLSGVPIALSSSSLTYIVVMRTTSAATGSTQPVNPRNTVIGDSTGGSNLNVGFDAGVMELFQFNSNTSSWQSTVGHARLDDGLMKVLVYRLDSTAQETDLFIGNFRDGFRASELTGGLEYDSVGQGFNNVDRATFDWGEILVYNVALVDSEINRVLTEYIRPYWMPRS